MSLIRMQINASCRFVFRHRRLWLGFEMAGLSKPILFCEIDKWCQKILRQHWRDVPILENVKDLANDQLDLFPIAKSSQQDIHVNPSPLPNRKGAEDDPHLVSTLCKLLHAKTPWCVFENVGGHISLGLDKVLSVLEAEDYSTRTFIIPACGVDAPHKRDRVWIVAHSNRNADRRTSRSSEEANGEIPEWTTVGSLSAGEVCAAALGNSEHDGQLTSRDIQSIEGSQKGLRKRSSNLRDK